MARVDYTDIRTAGPDAGRCGRCGDDIEEDTEYAHNASGMQICDNCLMALEYDEN